MTDFEIRISDIKRLLLSRLLYKLNVVVFFSLFPDPSTPLRACPEPVEGVTAYYLLEGISSVGRVRVTFFMVNGLSRKFDTIPELLM